MNKLKSIILNILSFKSFGIFIYMFFLLVFIFARSFMGIYIFGFRIGELFMGASLILFLSSLLFLNSEIKNKINKNLYYLHLSFIGLFFYNLINSNSSLSDPYTFRSSSYIWTIGFFYLGYFLMSKQKLNQINLYLFLPIIVYIYFFSIFGLPGSFENFILSISDKFEPHKGSDILIVFCSVFFIVNRFAVSKRLQFEIFIIFSISFLPLIAFKSRASFIALVLFLIMEIFYFKPIINQNIKRNLILGIVSLLFFVQSVFLVAGSKFLETSQENFISEVEYGLDYIASYRADPDDEVFRLFYVAYDDLGTRTTRIFSTDNNLNWRLQIWQDVIFDLKDKNQLLFGYGFKDIIPAMEKVDRQGLDRLNENVHNYLITLLARGGIVTLLLFIYMFVVILRNIININGFYYIVPYFVPVFFNTLFDVTMENSHFPLIFYFVLGMMYNDVKLQKSEI